MTIYTTHPGITFVANDVIKGETVAYLIALNIVNIGVPLGVWLDDSHH